MLPGPQCEDFPVKESGRFFSSAYAVTPQSDRTGIRLSGPKINRTDGLPESVISEGIVPGTFDRVKAGINVKRERIGAKSA